MSGINREKTWIITAIGLSTVLAINDPALSQRINVYFEGESSQQEVQDFISSSVGAGDIPRSQPANGSGVLGSSIYTGKSANIPSGGGYSPYAVSSVATPENVRRYTPMQPMSFVPSQSSIAVPGSTGMTSKVILDTASSMTGSAIQTAEKTAEFTKESLKTLAPTVPSPYRDLMVGGEVAMRAGDYDKATTGFEAARKMSVDSPESLLSLFNVSLATASGPYNQSADYLRGAMRTFPDLFKVRVCPKDFFGNEAEYQKAKDRLQEYTAKSPQDANALFVFGYLQWRDWQVEQAYQTLSTALAASKKAMDTLGTANILLLRSSIISFNQALAEDAPPLQEPADYPWAGVRMAIPKGFESQPLNNINQVLTATLGGEGTDNPQTVSLWAFPVRGNVLPATILDRMMDRMKAAPGLEGLSISEEANVAFLGWSAIVRIYSCTYYGDKVAMGRLCFVRPPAKAEDVGIAYVLAVGVLDKQQSIVLPMLATVAKSISLVDISRPTDIGAGVQSDVITDVAHGFSIRQPRSWAGRSTPTGYDMGEMDFLHGGIVNPSVQVIVTSIPADQDCKGFGEKVIQSKVDEGIDMKVLSSGPAKIGGVDGYQFIVRSAVKAGAPASMPAEGAQTAPAVGLAPRLDVARLVCAPGQDGTRTLYALIVTCTEDQQQRAEAIMDTLAAGFGLSIAKTAAAAGK